MIQADTWSADQYSKFEKERNRPLIDLLTHIPTGKVDYAIDIGCGPGNSTELLQSKYPGAVVSGIDSSFDMIKAAKIRMPKNEFKIADISDWQGNGFYDVIFANASLQWVPDHEKLFLSLINKLNTGGTLAVQMPDNFDEPTHRLMRNVADNGPWAAKLANAAKRIDRQSPEWYYRILHNNVSKLDIWRTTYYHVLEGGAPAIVEWVKGTGLRPYLDPLDADERAGFLAKYKAEIATAYPQYDEGTVLLPYPRLFIVATI